MTKLVKTSNTIAPVDDFSKELAKAIDTSCVLLQPGKLVFVEELAAHWKRTGTQSPSMDEVSEHNTRVVQAEIAAAKAQGRTPVFPRGSFPLRDELTGLRRRGDVVTFDIETSPWDNKRTRIDADVSELELRILAQVEQQQVVDSSQQVRPITIEEAEKLRKEFDEKFPGAKEALDLIARNGVTLDEQQVDTIAQRLEGDFSKMSRNIMRQWSSVFGSKLSVGARRLFARNAVEQAKLLGVAPDADTTVSICGCIWALQTTFNAGSGDVILRTCAEHSPKRKQ